MTYERYREMIEDSQDWFWEFDEKANFTYSSPRIRDMLGYDPEEVIGRNAFDLMDEDEAHRVRAFFDPIVEKYLPFNNLINVNTHKDGRKIVIESSGTPIFDSEGRFCGYRGIDRDITQRFEYDKELHSWQQKQLLSLNKIIELTGMGDRPDLEVYDKMLDAIVELTESQYGYLYFYDEITELFTLHAWSDQVAADCTVVNPQTQYSLEKTGFWGEVVRQRRTLINNDFAAVHPLKKGYPEGHAPVTSFMSVPIMSGKEIVAVAGVANKVLPYTDKDAIGLQEFCQAVWNILCQRQEHRLYLDEQARYQKLFEYMPIACGLHELLLDDDGIPHDYRFVYLNQVLVDLVGLAREEVIGRKASELFGKVQPELLARFTKVVKSGVEEDFEYYVAPTGKHLLLRCYSTGGNSFVTLAMDITAKHKLMERTLRNKIENREREHFSRELHDSAGQTFQAIRLYLGLIEDGNIPSTELPKIIAELDEEVGEAFGELREIAHQLHPEFMSDTDLQSAISNRCQRFKQRRQPVTFACTNSLPDLPLKAKSNLYRIFQEALSNAVHYSGAHNIEVTLHGVSSGVLLRVADNGRGMGEASEGFGIRAMRDRAELIGARFEFVSSPSGTCVTVEWMRNGMQSLG